MRGNVFTRWRPIVIDFEGLEVELELRAPMNMDGREVQRRLREWRRSWVATIGDTIKFVQGTAQEAEGVVPAQPLDSYELFDQTFGVDWSRAFFERSVRFPKGKEMVDEDGNAIAGGAALFERMGVGEWVSVLEKLEDMAHLRGKEGKASSSPSTSSAGTGASSGSPATSTAPGDGTAR